MKASELVIALERLMAQEGADPICCRETQFSGPRPVVSVVLKPVMQGDAGAIVPAKVEPPPSVIVIW
jgi:hypothetical protein